MSPAQPRVAYIHFGFQDDHRQAGLARALYAGRHGGRGCVESLLLATPSPSA